MTTQPVSLWTKLIAGDHLRLTRFHDEKGQAVGWRNAVNLPRNAILRLRQHFGFENISPWLPFSAIRAVEGLIKPDWRLLEFGSGMSTLWFARRCALVVSRESDTAWQQIVLGKLETYKAKIHEVDYSLANGSGYYDLAKFPDGYFDFVLVDGQARSKCVAASLPKLKAGGYLFLDNSDKDQTILNGDTLIAENLVKDAVRARRGTTTYFVDFAPSNLNAQESMLAYLP